MNYIMFCGNDGVGKTTMSKSLIAMLNIGYRVKTFGASFADGVRDELISLYGLPYDVVNNKSIDKKSYMITLGDYDYQEDVIQLWLDKGLIQSEREFDFIELSLRDLFVSHGTKIRRSDDDLYWNKILQNKVRINEQWADCVVIDDPRSPSDFDFDATIILIENGKPKNGNLEEQRFNNWLNDNRDRINFTLNVPVPLLNYNADCFNRQYILPLIRGKILK